MNSKNIFARKLSQPIARPRFRAPTLRAAAGPAGRRSVELGERGAVTAPVRGVVKDPVTGAVNEPSGSVCLAVALPGVCPLGAGPFLLGRFSGVILKFLGFLLMRAVSRLSALRKNHRTAALNSGGNFRRRTPSLQHAACAPHARDPRRRFPCRTGVCPEMALWAGRVGRRMRSELHCGRWWGRVGRTHGHASRNPGGRAPPTQPPGFRFRPSA